MFRLLGPAGTTQEAQLPSGTQTEDIMDELNRELWLLSAGGTRVMSRGEFIILKASGADVVVVGKERGGNVGGGGSDPAGGQEGGAEDGEEEVRVRMPMPKDWTHQHLLTFAFFGKLAAKEYRCPDLEPGEGEEMGRPTRRRRRNSVLRTSARPMMTAPMATPPIAPPLPPPTFRGAASG